MDGLLSLLLFALFFYIMMRFGCGAHMVHGGHGGHEGHGGHKKHGGQENEISHTDPVCGMQVDPYQGYGKMHQGKLIRFCSRKCLDKFDAEPDRFLKTREELS